MAFKLNIGIKADATILALAAVAVNVQRNSRLAMDVAAKDIAENIKKEFTGSPLGFHDRTGELRKSIRGGILQETVDGVVGFVGAGGENIGSDGKSTNEYVLFVEFPEFFPSKSRNTAFLRPGIRKNVRIIRKLLSTRLSRLR